MKTQPPNSKFGLLLDYGGVLTTSVAESFGAFCSQEGIEEKAFWALLLEALDERGSPFAQVETGAISDEDFERSVADLLNQRCGSSVEPVGLKQRLFAGTSPDQRMARFVRDARGAGVKTALVSNSWGLGTYPRDTLEELFDVVLLSCELGMRKPDPAIYLEAARRIGVRPRDCVFVDDLRANVVGAEAVGMTGVLHRKVEQTVARLGDLLGIGIV